MDPNRADLGREFHMLNGLWDQNSYHLAPWSRARTYPKSPCTALHSLRHIEQSLQNRSLYMLRRIRIPVEVSIALSGNGPFDKPPLLWIPEAQASVGRYLRPCC